MTTSNPAFKRDCTKMRSLLAPRWASAFRIFEWLQRVASDD